MTLHELLTLRPAFDAPGREELLRQILAGDAVAPRKVDPAIPRDLETIVLKAMSPEPSRRYGSAREMADDLARFLEGRPIRARGPRPPERAAMWARRHRPLVASTLGVLALALVVGSALLWREKRADRRGPGHRPRVEAGGRRRARLPPSDAASASGSPSRRRSSRWTR